MNSAEIETANPLDCSFTIIILNNKGFGLIKEQQLKTKGTSFGTELNNPDFQKYAGSFNVKEYRPNNLEELKTHLNKLLREEEISLIEIIL